MAILLKRQISEDEKKRIIEKFGRICYATGHPIDNEETVQFDHIKAFSSGGASEVDNIAPMCGKHNKQKGQLPLYDFKIKLKIEEFFESKDTLTLKDELEYLKSKGELKIFGDTISIIKNEDEEIELEILNKQHKYALYTCPTTKWQYFYATLPIEVLDSDDDADNEIGLQPRYLIKTKVFNLFRHFQRHPVLQPSICRIHKNRVLVFDGQHKIAGLLWGGRRIFECKVYINPEPQLLNKTNISAHDKFAQTRFFSSIMVAKLGAQFGREFEEYKNIEDNGKKTEAGFLDYLKEKERLTKAEINKRFRSFLYNSILDDNENKVSKLVSKSNRSSADTPITMDMLEKSIFSNFLYREPVETDMITENYLREKEFSNNIKLFNIIYDEGLYNWDSSKSNSDPEQLKLSRMFRSKSIMSWAEILFDAVCASLKLYDSDEKIKLMHRILSEEDFKTISMVLRRLFSWSMWTSPQNSEIDRILADNKSVVKEWLKDKGLTTGYLMGAPE